MKHPQKLCFVFFIILLKIFLQMTEKDHNIFHLQLHHILSTFTQLHSTLPAY